MIKDTQIIFCLMMVLLISCGKRESDSSSQSSDRSSADQPDDNKSQKEVILFFGNSLTAGYGVEPTASFPGLIQNRLDSLDLPYRVVNAGLSGETTASGVNRIEWVLRQPAKIMVLELGANDGLRGVDPEETKTNLQKIIDLTKTTYPDITIILAGMLAPPNMGQTYTDRFRDLFKELASENELLLIPFLLDGVAGESALNLADGIHPNEQGHKIVAENVWVVLKGVISDGL